MSMRFRNPALFTHFCRSEFKVFESLQGRVMFLLESQGIHGEFRKLKERELEK